MNSDVYVLDASAVLALLNNEPGADVVQSALSDSSCFMSVVNWSEVAKKLVDRELAINPVAQSLIALGLDFKDFDYQQALTAAGLKAPSLSLGDRACLALTLTLKATALTADKVWRTSLPNLNIELIR